MTYKRIITAIIFVPIIFFIIRLGFIPFFLFVLICGILGLSEFYDLVRKIGFKPRNGLGVVLGLLLMVSIFINNLEIASNFSNNITGLFLFLVIFILFLFEIVWSDIGFTLPSIAITLFGIFYVNFTLGHLILLRNVRPDGLYYTFLLFSVVWLGDTASWYFGINYGERKLSPVISPKKTVVGAVASIIISIIIAFIFKFLFLKNLTFPDAFNIGLLGSISSQLGDLSESIVKRSAGVKDSSNIIPGHGGILDKLDSFIFAAPTIYYYIKFTQNLY